MAVADPRKLIDIRHPHYRAKSSSWLKWRYVYEGGDPFVDKYVLKFSDRENVSSYLSRRKITPSAAFAKSAVNKIKDSIFQRLGDIVRRGGSDSYQRAITGADNGVDLHGQAMTTYMGREALPELLTMARVGIYVDRAPLEGPSIKDQQGNHPYLYLYKTEEILSWSYRRDRVDEFQSLLLRDWIDEFDDESGLPCDQWCRYRHVWIDANGKVNVQFYDDNNDACDINGEVLNSKDPVVLDIDRIPFVILEISDSLLADVSNHQIALVNLESSDVSYILKAGFPFYTEQKDDTRYSAYLKPEQPTNGQGTAAEANEGRPADDTNVGATQGRFYGKGMERPGFIHPSSEPITASMAKQAALKDDIERLVNLAVTNTQPKMASAESKGLDERSLEAGLSAIGLVLEHAEQKIATYWQLYDKTGEPATIRYPKSYSLQTDESRRADVEQLEKLRDSIPSESFQKTISKSMAFILLGGRISIEDMDAIYKEIDNAECYTANPDIIFLAVENGIMSLKIAADLLGLPEESVKQAADDHAARAARVALAQSSVSGDPAARGVPDLSANPGSAGSAEKKQSVDTTTDTSVTDKQRGAGQ